MTGYQEGGVREFAGGAMIACVNGFVSVPPRAELLELLLPAGMSPIVAPAGDGLSGRPGRGVPGRAPERGVGLAGGSDDTELDHFTRIP